MTRRRDVIEYRNVFRFTMRCKKKKPKRNETARDGIRARKPVWAVFRIVRDPNTHNTLVVVDPCAPVRNRGSRRQENCSTATPATVTHDRADGRGDRERSALAKLITRRPGAIVACPFDRPKLGNW